MSEYAIINLGRAQNWCTASRVQEIGHPDTLLCRYPIVPDSVDACGLTPLHVLLPISYRIPPLGLSIALGEMELIQPAVGHTEDTPTLSPISTGAPSSGPVQILWSCATSSPCSPETVAQ